MTRYPPTAGGHPTHNLEAMALQDSMKIDIITEIVHHRRAMALQEDKGVLS